MSGPPEARARQAFTATGRVTPGAARPARGGTRIGTDGPGTIESPTGHVTTEDFARREPMAAPGAAPEGDGG